MVSNKAFDYKYVCSLRSRKQLQVKVEADSKIRYYCHNDFFGKKLGKYMGATLI